MTDTSAILAEAYEALDPIRPYDDHRIREVLRKIIWVMDGEIGQLRVLQGEAWEDGYDAAQKDWVSGAERATENPFVIWTEE